MLWRAKCKRRRAVAVDVPERHLDAPADQHVVAVEALGVDPEQDLDRVPGPLGHRHTLAIRCHARHHQGPSRAATAQIEAGLWEPAHGLHERFSATTTRTRRAAGALVVGRQGAFTLEQPGGGGHGATGRTQYAQGGGRPSLPAVPEKLGVGGRSHSETRVGSMVWSTTWMILPSRRRKMETSSTRSKRRPVGACLATAQGGWLNR